MTLIETIHAAMAADDSDDSERLIAQYEQANPATREALDYAFICLCGWSLSTLITKAKEDTPS